MGGQVVRELLAWPGLYLVFVLDIVKDVYYRIKQAELKSEKIKTLQK